jgi:hypothetical protein
MLPLRAQLSILLVLLKAVKHQSARENTAGAPQNQSKTFRQFAVPSRGRPSTRIWDHATLPLLEIKSGRYPMCRRDEARDSTPTAVQDYAKLFREFSFFALCV